MISPKIQDAINAQINAEFWSAYLYLAMGMHFEAEGRTGIANWFRIQFKEEQAHAEIFINYLLSRGGRVVLKPIADVPESWASPLAAFEDTLAHEEKVTALINNLYALAESEHDYATRGKLDWQPARRASPPYRQRQPRPLYARPGTRYTRVQRPLTSGRKGIMHAA